MNFIAPLLCGNIQIPQGPLLEWTKQPHVSFTEKDTPLPSDCEKRMLPSSNYEAREEGAEFTSEEKKLVSGFLIANTFITWD